jgi:transposase InsO family protein
MLGFIDTMRAEGHAVESIIRVLREQGVKIAARTYRAHRQGVIAARTITDAQVQDAIRAAAWTVVERGGTMRRVLTPEGLYGRRKMTALIRRTSIPDASRGAVDRAMRALGLSGIRRDKGVRTTIPAKDGIRAGDLLNRDFTAPRPDHTWVMDFTYCRTWAGWVYVAFIVDVYSQRIVAWHAQTTKHVELVMIPLRMALWERGRQGHPIQPEQLRAHSDAGSQYVSLAYTDKLALDGIAPSIGSVGDALDNALMETINGCGSSASPLCGTPTRKRPSSGIGCSRTTPAMPGSRWRIGPRGDCALKPGSCQRSSDPGRRRGRSPARPSTTI